MKPPPDPGFVDRPAARVVALSVALAAAAALAWIHRDDLLAGGGARTVPAEERAFIDCYQERSRDIDTMAAEGTITAEQASMFKSRAEAMCRDTAGGNPASPPPGQ